MPIKTHCNGSKTYLRLIFTRRKVILRLRCLAIYDQLKNKDRSSSYVLKEKNNRKI
ncbi:hypothetical protein THOM_1412 [Trachipleistophora hominis]|uniref:Uncharacterized protein n=1 Tax=Trachipleistophora hominis TaxID=72359 RepID=L7JX66_TRAHO|nr:hypothetical protein THOM_1412 [Trachipleistophora hominis]